MFLKSIKEGMIKGIETTLMLAKVLVPVYFVVTLLFVAIGANGWIIIIERIIIAMLMTLIVSKRLKKASGH